MAPRLGQLPGLLILGFRALITIKCRLATSSDVEFPTIDNDLYQVITTYTRL